MNSRFLKMQAELLAIYAEIEGMKAENMQRQHRGESMAWDNNQFCVMAQRARDVVKNIDADYNEGTDAITEMRVPVLPMDTEIDRRIGDYLAMDGLGKMHTVDEEAE